MQAERTQKSNCYFNYLHNALLWLFILCVCSESAHAFDFARPLDRGGGIAAYQGRILTETGQHVIDGDCMSACTMWLSHKKTCVTAHAVLWFHAAAGTMQLTRGANPWRAISSKGNRALLNAYPPRLRAVVEPWLRSPDFHTLTGLQAAALGVPLCAQRSA